MVLSIENRFPGYLGFWRHHVLMLPAFRLFHELYLLYQFPIAAVTNDHTERSKTIVLFYASVNQGVHVKPSGLKLDVSGLLSFGESKLRLFPCFWRLRAFLSKCSQQCLFRLDSDLTSHFWGPLWLLLPTAVIQDNLPIWKWLTYSGWPYSLHRRQYIHKGQSTIVQ